MQRAVILDLNLSNVRRGEGEVMAMSPRIASSAVESGYTVRRDPQHSFAKPVNRHRGYDLRGGCPVGARVIQRDRHEQRTAERE